jgi:hypothetical protein
MDVAFSRGADFRPGQFSPPGQSVAQALNDANEAPAPAHDAPLDAALNHRAGDPEASFARSYDRAQATIASDEELRTTVRMAKNAGDEKFKDRLATIMANLERDPKAALDAIRSEIFNSQIHNRTSLSGVAAVAASATLKAINRLDALQPELGIWQAREAGFQPAVRLSQDQQRAIYRIATDPNLSPGEKLDEMSKAGLFDVALASGLMAMAGFAFTARRTPGVTSGSGTKLEGPWLSGNTEASIPAQVADLLRGRTFSTFDEFRRALWKAVASVPELASEFSAESLARVRVGLAPMAPRGERGRCSEVFNLHHPRRIADGGEVYDVDNMMVVTPRRHDELHH